MFTPEFRNRLDAIISFAPLPTEVVRRVVEKFVLQLESQLAERNITITLTPEAADWLAERGYDERMGARPLSRVIQEHVKKPLADEVLFGQLQNGGTRHRRRDRRGRRGPARTGRRAADAGPAQGDHRPEVAQGDRQDDAEDAQGQAQDDGQQDDNESIRARSD